MFNQYIRELSVIIFLSVFTLIRNYFRIWTQFVSTSGFQLINSVWFSLSFFVYQSYPKADSFLSLETGSDRTNLFQLFIIYLLFFLRYSSVLKRHISFYSLMYKLCKSNTILYEIMLSVLTNDETMLKINFFAAKLGFVH